MAFKFTSIKKNWNKIQKELEKEEEEKGNRGAKPEWLFEPKREDGKAETLFRIRFLPIPGITTKPYIELKYHLFIRAGDGRYIKVLDPKQFDKNAENPISDKVQILYKSDNKFDTDLAGKMRSKSRYFTLVYVKEAPSAQKDYEGKVLVYEAGYQLYQKWEAVRKKQDLCYWDPFEGADFLLTITETGNKNQKFPCYTQSEFDRKEGPISDDEEEMEKIAKMIDALGDIKQKIIDKDGIRSGKELKELLEGGLKEVSDTVSSKSSKDLVSNDLVSDDDPDFGEADESDNTDDEVEKVKTEVEVDGDDIDIDFSDEDFNIDDD